MLKLIIALTTAFAGSAAAQTFAPGSPAQQVQLLAPQLVAFSGSAGNFDSLVSGLTSAGPVTLAAANSDGSLQIVTFTPGTALSVVDTARILETARQSLIVRGITAPTGPQLAAALFGGTITVPSGAIPLTGILSGSTTPSTPVNVRTDAGALQGGLPSNLTNAQLQALRDALVSGNRVTLTTGAGNATQNVTFTPTGRLSDAAAAQALQSATALLAQQGVVNPTAEQLRTALFGGTLAIGNGAQVVVQGVLQAELRNTSDSRIVNTSASASVNTSASPSVSAGNTGGGVATQGSAARTGAPAGAAPASAGVTAPAATAGKR